MSTMEHQSEEGKKFIQRATQLANVLGISIAQALKKLHAEAAHKMFQSDEKLQEWEKKNFPETKDEDN